MVSTLSCAQTPNWLNLAQEALHYTGAVLLLDAFDEGTRCRTRDAIRDAQGAYHGELGPERLAAARLRGDVDIRMPMKYHPQFLQLLETPAMLSVLERYLSPDAILRFCNAFAQPPRGVDEPRYLQNSFHMNYKQVLNGYPASIDFLFVIDCGAKGTTFDLAPGTHQRMAMPSAAYLECAAQTVRLPTGSLFVMDATLWHRECTNQGQDEWLSVQYNFVQPFLKPHLDYVRALGANTVAALPPRMRRLLGWEARIPADLDEFYQPPAQRVYQAPWHIGMDQPSECPQETAFAVPAPRKGKKTGGGPSFS